MMVFILACEKKKMVLKHFAVMMTQRAFLVHDDQYLWMSLKQMLDRFLSSFCFLIDVLIVLCNFYTEVGIPRGDCFHDRKLTKISQIMALCSSIFEVFCLFFSCFEVFLIL